MKKIFGILFTMAAFTFQSCTDDAEDVSNFTDQTAIAIEDASLETTSSELFEDVDEAADFATNSKASSSGRTIDDKGPGGERFGDCVTVTEDEGTSTITIDFGEDGCEGRDGRVRKGKIIIVHEGEREVAGSNRTITFEGFSIDTMEIEGVRVLTYVSGTDVEKVFTGTLTGGKITFPDGTSATRESEHTRVATAGEDGEKLQMELYGLANGVNREGLIYSNVIDETTPLLSLSTCREERTFAPVSGILSINIEGESEKVIDFGDGACDNLVTITQDGISTEEEIDPKHRRKRKFRKGH